MRQGWLLEYRLPLAAPFTFAGQRLPQRRGLILRLTDGAREGFGEAAPLPGFSRESLSEVQAELGVLIDSWCHQGDRAAPQSLNPLAPATAFAWSLAQHELDHGSLQPKNRLPAALLLGASGAELVDEIAQGLETAPGARVAKVKVGRVPLAEDIERLKLVAQQLPDFTLRLDGNRSWTLSQVLELRSVLPELPVAFLEEPLINGCDLPAMAQATGWGYALDETLYEPGFALQPAPGLVALVLKPSLFGSLQRCEELVQAANSADLELVISSSFESSLGNTHLYALAEQWCPDTAPGLDTLKHLQSHRWQREQLRERRIKAQNQVVRCIGSWTSDQRS